MIDWNQRILEAAIRGTYKPPVQAAVYNVAPAHEEVIRAKGRQALAEFVKPGMRVVDLGCGYGAVRSLLPWDVYYTGIDLFGVFLDEARRIYAGFLDHGTEFVLGDIVEVLNGLPPDSFDLAVSRGLGSDVPGVHAAALRVAPVYVALLTESEVPEVAYRGKA